MTSISRASTSGSGHWRVCEVWACTSSANKKYRFGSGYFLNKRFIVTARHVVFGREDKAPEGIEVRSLEAAEGDGERSRLIACSVYDAHPTRDLIVLEVEQHEGPIGDTTSLGRFARRARVDVSGCGFPDAMAERTEKGVLHEASDFYGSIGVAAGLKDDAFYLDVHASPTVTTGWQGLSGSGVLKEEKLLGIVSHALPSFEGRLRLVPATCLLELEKLRAALGGLGFVVATVGDADPDPLEDFLDVLCDEELLEKYVAPTMAPLEGGEAFSSASFLEQLLDEGDPRTFVGLVGTGGSGKTHLLNYIAAQTAKSVNRRECRYLPLRLDATDIAGWKATQDSDVLVGAARESRLHERGIGRPPLPTDFVVKWSRDLNARWLVLIDGVDEVLPANRDTFDKRLDTIAGWLKKSGGRIVVSTRSIGLLEAKTRQSFSWVNILPFSDAQQRDAAVRWTNDAKQPTSHAFWQQLPVEVRSNPMFLSLWLKDPDLSAESASEVTVTSLYARYVDVTLARHLGVPTNDDPQRGLLVSMVGELAVWSGRTRGERPRDFEGFAVERIARDWSLGVELVRMRFRDLLAKLGGDGRIFSVQGERLIWKHQSIRCFLAAQRMVDKEADPLAIALSHPDLSNDETPKFIACLMPNGCQEQLREKATESPAARILVAESVPLGFPLGAIGASIAHGLMEDLARQCRGVDACSMLWQLYDGQLPLPLKAASCIPHAASTALSGALTRNTSVFFLSRVITTALAHVSAFDVLVETVESPLGAPVGRIQALRALAAAREVAAIQRIRRRALVDPLMQHWVAACLESLFSPDVAADVDNALNLPRVFERSPREVAAGWLDGSVVLSPSEVFWLGVRSVEQETPDFVCSLLGRPGTSRRTDVALLAVLDRYECVDAMNTCFANAPSATVRQHLRDILERHGVIPDRGFPTIVNAHHRTAVGSEADGDAKRLAVHHLAEGREITLLRTIASEAADTEIRVHAIKALANLGASRSLDDLRRSCASVECEAATRYITNKVDGWFGRLADFSPEDVR